MKIDLVAVQFFFELYNLFPGLNLFHFQQISSPSTFKIKKPPGVIVGDVNFPTSIFDSFSLIVLLNTELFIQPNFPPFFAVSDKLNFIAASAKLVLTISFSILSNFILNFSFSFTSKRISDNKNSFCLLFSNTSFLINSLSTLIFSLNLLTMNWFHKISKEIFFFIVFGFIFFAIKISSNSCIDFIPIFKVI